MERTDAQLALEAQRGDTEAYAVLVKRHWESLVRLARSILGEADAEDMVQEALVVGWKWIAGLREPGAVGAWLARITARRSLAHARRQRRMEPLETVAEPGRSENPGAWIDVERMLMALAPRQRAVMYLTVVEGMTDSEIGKVLALRPGSVRAHRRRARQRLERMLREAEDARTQRS